MWLLFGIISIITAILNLINFDNIKKSEIFSFISLSFTSITIWSFFDDIARRNESGDLSGVMDIAVRSLSIVLLICIITSMILNFIPIYKRMKNNI